MLSIIICSINKPQRYKITANIKRTIGIAHELIIIDNIKEKLSIAKAYNKGVQLAQYEYLVFCHEDILFHTQNWGQFIIDDLKKDNIGLIGVSGALIKTKAPVNWSKIPQKYCRISALQHFGNKKVNVSFNPTDDLLTQVAVLDGFFLSGRKKVFQEIPFDENNLKGFHLYDMDISLRIGLNYKLFVSHKLLLEHFSPGKLDKNWFKESLKWHENLKTKLPIMVDITPNEANEIYFQNLKDTILFSIKFNYSRIFELKTLFKMSLIKLRRDNLLLLKFILAKFIKTIFLKTK